MQTLYEQIVNIWSMRWQENDVKGGISTDNIYTYAPKSPDYKLDGGPSLRATDVIGVEMIAMVLGGRDIHGTGYRMQVGTMQRRTIVHAEPQRLSVFQAGLDDMGRSTVPLL